MTTLRGRLRPLAAAIITIAAVAVGHTPAHASVGRAPAAVDLPSWTIIYYGVAGNNLEAPMLNDVKEMGIGDFGGEVNLFGFLDREPEDNSTSDGELIDGSVPGLGEWTGGKVFEAVEGKLVELLDLGQVDAGSPDTLAWFVSEVMRIAPADHTALILSDHGFGPLAFGVDDDEKSQMTITEIADALDRGIPGTDKLDLIAFDACLMATAEVIYWLSPYATRMVVSEDLVPGFGFDYRDLRGVIDDPNMDGQALGELLVESFGNQYGGFSDYAKTSLSLVDPLLAGSFSGSLNELATAIVDTGSTIQFQRALADSKAAIPLDPESITADLGDLARRLAQPEFPDRVRIAADNLFAFVDRIVLTQYRGQARKENTGISIVAPAPELLDDVLTQYEANGIYPWVTFLRTLADEVAATPQQATGAMWAQDAPTLLISSAEGVAISSSLNATVAQEQGLSRVRALFGEPTDGGGMYLFVVDSAVQDGETTTFVAAWDYSVYAVTNDEREWVYPTVFVSRGASGVTASAAGTVIEANGNRVPVSLRWSIDAENSTLGNLALFSTGESVAEYLPPPGAVLQLDQFVLSPDGLDLDVDVAGEISLDGEVIVSHASYGAGSTVAVGLAAVDTRSNWYGNFGFVKVPS